MKTINLGVIGLGRIGKLHIDNIKKYLSNFHLVAAADLMIDKEWAKQHSDIQFSNNPSYVLNHADIQAVLICTPVDTHARFILQAAIHRKHVFCEKPLARKKHDIEQIIKGIEQAGIICQVGFNRRFDRNFAYLHKQIHDKTLGRTYIIRITSRDPGLPPMDYIKQSGGLFMDMSIHDFDMAQYLVKSTVKSVFAKGAAKVDTHVADYKDIDTAIVNIEFEDGTLAIIDNCRHAEYGYDQRIEVLCEKGSVSANNTRPTNVITRFEHGETIDNPHHFFLERYQQSYVSELSAFYHAIVNKTPAMVSPKDSLHVLKIVEAANQSLQSNQVITLQ